MDFAPKKSKIPSGENQHEQSEVSCKPAMEMTFINLKTQDTRLRAICRGNSDLAFGKQYFCRLNSTPKELDKGGFGSQHFPRLFWCAWVRTTFLDSSQVTLENCLFLMSKFFWVLHESLTCVQEFRLFFSVEGKDGLQTVKEGMREEGPPDRGLACRHLVCKRQDAAGSMSEISWPCANQGRTPWLHQFKRWFQAI